MTTEGTFYVGSTEWMNENVANAFQKILIDAVELPSGNYVIDVYSFLIKDSQGKPKYIQFAFCIFPEDKYINTDTQLRTVTQPLPLKYQE